MTIKEVEKSTGLKRSNIRFYEQENLIQPARNQKNGYREYSAEDVENIQKIAYLRTLGFSIEEIVKITRHQMTLKTAIETQSKKLDSQIQELQKAKQLCISMVQDETLDYDSLDVEKYVSSNAAYWHENQNILKADSVQFIYLWGGRLIWGILTFVCLLIAICSFSSLPMRIPIQWSHGKAVADASRVFLFIYPLACLVIRLLLKPFIWRWLHIHDIDKEGIVDYLTNFLCFVCMSLEIFTILFVFEILSRVTLILIVDAVVFLGMLLIAWNRLADR